MKHLVMGAALVLVACGGKAIESDTNTDGSTTGDSSTTGDTSTSTTDSSTSTTDTASLPKTETGSIDYCAAMAERAMKCGSSGFDKATCESQLVCYRNAMRPGEYDAIATCLATRDCMTKDDTCVANVAMKYITDPWTQNYVKTCNEKRTACMNIFSDDHCGYDHGLLKDELRAKFDLCLSRSCAEIKDCFNTVTAAVGCK
jgi:hypothetical protein